MDINNSSVNDTKEAPVVPANSKNNVVHQTDKESKKWITGAIVSALLAVIALIFFLVNLPKFTTNTGSADSNISSVGHQLANNLIHVTSATDSKVSQQAYEDLQKNLDTIKTAVANPEVQSQSPDFVEAWAENQKKIEFILSNKNQIDQMLNVLARVEQTMPELQHQYRKMVEKMLGLKATTNQVVIANNQVWLAEKISHKISLLKAGQIVDGKELMQDIQQFGATIEAEMTGTPAIQQITNPIVLQDLQLIKESYEKNLKPSVEQMSQMIDINKKVRQQAKEVQQFASSNHINATYGNSTNFSQQFVGLWLPLLGLILGFLAVLFFTHRLIRAKTETERKVIERETLRQRHEMEVEFERARQIQEENKRNQSAILRLLDELGDLAEGDLTVNATVSEDFTGAIADSVNFAIDQLRQLVSAINVTAERVARASDQTQATAVELAEASESQAQEIAGVSSAINEMAVSIDQVSANASKSATVADRSVAIAYNGVEVVQRTIDGMNTIRDQIQETSKRIKRLGESSQEIGDIVGLINDIADQTNILALNAAIQASMAGEAGRGFAVVADEVQRLAERSAHATKQIESLVKTIQADTNEAVRSMESTTTEVVRGAKLAKDAGEALEEVQTVSNDLAQLIQSISNAARQQAASAGHISNTMNIIQDITSQTTSGTMATARSIGQLNEMATALQESVSGFKLPEEDLMR